ncbi:hypothetical protein EGM_20537, partial [Macaca fascicularis]
VNAGVTQTPKFQILKTGQNMTLKCAQDMNHDYMYWYRQDPGMGLRLIHYSATEDTTDPAGLPSDRFSAERTEGSVSTLKIQRTEQGDSAVYLCASSLA